VRHEKLLPGPYGSEESLAAKAWLGLELATSPTRNAVESVDLTVAEVIAAYMAFAARYYVDAEGKLTKELESVKVAAEPVREPVHRGRHLAAFERLKPRRSAARGRVSAGREATQAVAEDAREHRGLRFRN
jgi:hypothetical protein